MWAAIYALIQVFARLALFLSERARDQDLADKARELIDEARKPVQAKRDARAAYERDGVPASDPFRKPPKPGGDTES